MSDNIENNPFFGLFGSVSEAQTYSHQNVQSEEPTTAEEVEVVPEPSSQAEDQESTGTSSGSRRDTAINAIIEDVFCITISKKPVSSEPLLYMEETADCLNPVERLDIHALEQALFERLLLTDPSVRLLKPASRSNSAINHHVIEKEVLTYLFECHKQLMDLKRFKPELADDITHMDELVIRNFATALHQPDLYAGQELPIQFLNMFNDYDISQDHLTSLITSVVELSLQDEGAEQGVQLLRQAFTPVLDEIKERAKISTLLTLNRYHMYLIRFFSSNSILGNILLSHSTPSDERGSSFGNTLFGAILSTSYLPKSTLPSDQFQFDRSMESSCHTGQQFICDFMHSVFLNLFKNSLQSRHALLRWIGKCLHTNSSRGRLANTHENELSQFTAATAVSDGFMMNMCGVLLRLCTPFIGTKAISKLLKIDPTYCAVQVNDDNEASERWVHMKAMSSETCLISLNSDNDGSEPVNRPTALSYNFLTEIFFMTHKALDLGLRVLYEKWTQLTQELARTQRQLETTQQSLPETAQTIRQILETPMAKSMAMHTCLLEPKNLVLLGDLYVATAEWLIQVTIQPPTTREPESFAPMELRPLAFPLPEPVPATLSCVPEFLMENIVCYQSMVCRYAPQTLESKGTDFLEPLLSLVLVFMGSKQHMRNPHLRARFAECLESLLPHQNDNSAVQPPPVGFNREALFRSHPHRSQIVPCLLSVFVGIEMTGEGVTFEQKFNYRRPMYLAMQYLWTLEEQREVFKSLAVEAEANIRATKQPLFYHFINLLMNDAVYLLDEALTNMNQLRNLQNARDNGEWENLPMNERQQNLGRLMHIGMMARFDNILGKETIHTLQYLTTEITSIFCHPLLVERVASMLNYFLMHLVGPKKKNFKVKDQQDYDFKPADLVMNICRIYVNLGKCDEFCSAVSKDGRSYSPKLFEQAEQVLVRIGGGMLITDLMQVASRVADMAVQQNAEDEAFADGPEEFYDPILSTLMEDPVILPTSRIRCDRDTIARHLLSDQTDPFTKAPLTLDQVISDTELKERIHEWKKERLSQHATKNASIENASLDTE